MMGSGTVLALARAAGHRAIGVDVDPLAVLMSKVWTTAISRREIRSKASIVLAKARKTFKEIAIKDAYPTNSDRETRKFVRYWFDNYARRQISALAASIRGVRDSTTRDVLWCAFSRLIITKQAGVSLARDLAHSRPHKSFDRAPIKPFSNFLNAVELVIANCVSRSCLSRGPAPIVQLGDARKLSLNDGSVDLVLTSPPYLNAIDYMRCSKFSLIWMGCTAKELRNLRSNSVGSEVGEYEPAFTSMQIMKRLGIERRLSRRDRAVLYRFIEDMRATLMEVSRVLVPGGKAIFVLGDNTVRGTYIRNSKIIRAIASEAGLRLRQTHKRTLPPNRRYLPPPSRSNVQAALDARLRREIILSFVKPNIGPHRKSSVS